MRALALSLVVLALPLASAVAQQGKTSAPTADTHVATVAEQVVQTQLEAYNRRDLEAFLATYAPDVRLYDHPNRLRTTGLDEMRRGYGEFFARAPELHARVTQRIVQGDFVIDHEHVTGLPGGAEIRAVAIYEVRNGRIQNVWFIR